MVAEPVTPRHAAWPVEAPTVAIDVLEEDHVAFVYCCEVLTLPHAVKGDGQEVFSATPQLDGWITSAVSTPLTGWTVIVAPVIVGEAPATVNEIVDVQEAFTAAPVTTPVDELTVAHAVLLDEKVADPFDGAFAWKVARIVTSPAADGPKLAAGW
jgi:hypothetical protein